MYETLVAQFDTYQVCDGGGGNVCVLHQVAYWVYNVTGLVGLQNCTLLMFGSYCTSQLLSLCLIRIGPL